MYNFESAIYLGIFFSGVVYLSPVCFKKIQIDVVNKFHSSYKYYESTGSFQVLRRKLPKICEDEDLILCLIWYGFDE